MIEDSGTDIIYFVNPVRNNPPVLVMPKMILICEKMVKTIRRFSRYFILLSLCYPARAAEYYVEDASEIQDAMSRAQPGDTLTMANGIWVDEDIDFFGNGEDGLPILLRAETPGYVILTGKSRMDISGSYLVVDGLYFLNGTLDRYKVHVISISSYESRYCRITNTAVVNYNAADWELHYKWLQVKGEYHRVDHCYFSGKTHRDAMVKIVTPSNSRFDHNYLGDIDVGKTDNNWEALRIQGADVSYGHVIVEDNLFYHCDGEIEIISLKAGDNDIRRNTFYECIGTVTCRKNESNRIYGNFFIGNDVPGTAGVRMYSKDHQVYNNYFERLMGGKGAIAFVYGQHDSLQLENPEVENVTVVFNTMVECDPNIEVGIMYSVSSGRVVPPRDLLIANNITYKTTGVMINHGDGVENISYAGNIMFGTTLGISDSAGITLVDPQLELADGIWRLTTDSPALNGAVGEYPYVTIDIDGQDRVDGLNDIGSDELSTESIVSCPLTKEEVGPTWIHNANLPVALSVTRAGTGSGIVTLDPPGGIYDISTVVTMIAVPEGEDTFVGWSGDVVSTDDTVTVVMDGHKKVVATFQAAPAYDIALWTNGSGQVQFEPPAGPYPEGTVVTLTAMPDPGWSFSHWGGALSSSANPDSLVMDDNKAITATFVQTAIGVAVAPGMPVEYGLEQNFPNPFNPTTTISFALKDAGFTTLIVYDVMGRKVAEPVNRYLEAGVYKFEFDAFNLSSGVYFYKITSGKFTSIKKMILIQ